MKKIIRNPLIVNENEQYRASILIQNGIIAGIFHSGVPQDILRDAEIIEAADKVLIPGVIDDQVHFREPGLTYKADIYTESKAAIAGGITSFMEMPNTRPPATTQQLLEEKYRVAAEKSLANFSFYIGATNNNLNELLQTDKQEVCGIKIFMGSSTGNMLVDDKQTLAAIFSAAQLPVAVHCEDETTIQQNIAKFRQKFGENVPIASHPEIRSEEACYKSSAYAVKLARKYNTRLHVLHVSTGKELSLFDNTEPLHDKRITAEVCVHHLWFDSNDYAQHGTRIKWNPAIKTAKDKEALLNGLLNNRIDVIATDHAPHTLNEKNNTYFKAPSGAPMVQHALPVMLQLFHQKKISLTKIVEKMSHAPATLFQIDKRGYIRKGYHADLVLLDLNQQWRVHSNNILYKCKWSPLENMLFHSAITHTFVNGNLVYCNGVFREENRGMRLLFNR